MLAAGLVGTEDHVATAEVEPADRIGTPSGLAATILPWSRWGSTIERSTATTEPAREDREHRLVVETDGERLPRMRQPIAIGHDVPFDPLRRDDLRAEQFQRHERDGDEIGRRVLHPVGPATTRRSPRCRLLLELLQTPADQLDRRQVRTGTRRRPRGDKRSRASPESSQTGLAPVWSMNESKHLGRNRHTRLIIIPRSGRQVETTGQFRSPCSPKSSWLTSRRRREIDALTLTRTLGGFFTGHGAPSRERESLQVPSFFRKRLNGNRQTGSRESETSERFDHATKKLRKAQVSPIGLIDPFSSGGMNYAQCSEVVIGSSRETPR